MRENVARASNVAERCCADNIAGATIPGSLNNEPRTPEWPLVRALWLLGQAVAAGAGRVAGEDLRQRRDLVRAQLLEEALVDRREVACLRLANQVEAGFGQVSLDGACVRSGRAPLYQFAALERVDDP